MIRIVLADDHKMLVEALASILEKESDIEIIGIASNGVELMSFLERQLPDICLLDIEMPKMNGIVAMKQIRVQYPMLPVLALTMYDDPRHVRQMIESGVRGYILKNRSQDFLVEAIRTILSEPEEVFFESAIRDRFIRTFSGTQVPKKKYKHDLQRVKITPREKEVLIELASGRTSKEMAEILCISENTFVSHKAALMKKLGVNKETALVRFAVEQGFLSDTLNIEPDL
ncbi:MAG: response regulator transcription factor [Bacteroidota bacterium]